MTSIILSLLLCLAKDINFVNAAVVAKEIRLNQLNNPCVSSQQFFDSSSHTCEFCSSYISNTSPDPASKDPWGNYDRCKCNVGYQKNLITTCANQQGSCNSFSCATCSPKAAYRDNSACVACDATTSGYSSKVQDCECPVASPLLIETDNQGNKLASKTCGSCPEGSQVITTSSTTIAGVKYTKDLYQCQYCPDQDLMEMTISNGVYRCSCIAGYTLVGDERVGSQSCVSTELSSIYSSAAQSTAITVEYFGKFSSTVTSLTFKHFFLDAATKCSYYSISESVRYCQILANLCVLQMYDDTSSVCQIHQTLINARSFVTTNNIYNWVPGQPWLYLAQNDAGCFLNMYGRKLSLQTSFMEYTVAKFNMNGTFIGYFDLDTMLSYCGRSAPFTQQGGGTSSSTKYQLFGRNQNVNITCELADLYYQKSTQQLVEEQFFYEIFLTDRKGLMAPLMVRNVNLRTADVPLIGTLNDLYPKFLCDPADVVTRRFFLTDFVSGIDSSTNQLKVIRYANYINLEMGLNPLMFRKVLPPVLTIHYEEIPVLTSKQMRDGEYFQVQTAASYTMDMVTFNTRMYAGFVFTVIFCSFVFAIRLYYWNVRNTRSPTIPGLSADAVGGSFNFKSAYQAVISICYAWNLFFFPFTLIICWYFFLFFKVQYLPIVFMPPQQLVNQRSSPYFPFVANLYVMAFFQLLIVIDLVIKQCSADIFFIDWEPFKVPKKASSDRDDAPGVGQVSVWRSIMVANEWSEMQTMRKTDIRFTLFWIGFLLIGLDLQYNATHQTDLEDKDQAEVNIILRFGNTAFFWLLFSFMQYIFKYAIYERFISEPPEQLFVDFCTISKVSVLVLDENFHGYYLHCRSPHQYADGSMTELVEMLHKEEAGLVTDRGLDGAPADVQSFEVFLSGEFRSNFNKIYVALCGPASIAEGINSAPGARGRGGDRRFQGQQQGREQSVRLGSVNYLPSEKVMKAWRELTVFLQEFVENNFGMSGMRRVVKEPTYTDRALGACPDLSIPDQPSVFFTDRDFEYTKVLFLGREYALLMLNICTYSLVDLWFDSVATSILLTYLLECLLCYVRQNWGQRTVARKTLIDGRFLI